MRKIVKYTFLCLSLGLIYSSCLKDEIAPPSVEGLKFYSLDENNKYQEVANPENGVTYTLAVQSSSDIVVIWPGGERSVMKKKGTEVDSLDINGNQVLVKSNYYSDYGLLRAQGLKTNLNNEIGWSTQYKYPESGTFDVVIVATNHGYDSFDFQQETFPYQVTIQ